MKRRRVNVATATSVDDPHQSAAPELQPQGNAAMAAQVGGFEAQHATPDHIEMGGDRVLRIGPHTLTSGQLNALSDYVRDPSELESMSVAELQRGIELSMREPLSVADEAELMAIFPDYAELSLNNSNHFGASDPALCEPSGGGHCSPNYRSEIAHWLGGAVEQARTAGEQGDGAGRELALVDAAFGSHFIADGFSAGHLFNKDDLVASMGEGLDAAGREGQLALVGGASQRIHTEGAAQLAQWRHVVEVGDVAVRSPITLLHINTLLGVVVALDRPLFGNGVALAVHEVLSEAGVEVTDGSHTWTMFGDHHLDDTTFERASGLIDRSLHLVEQAFDAPDSTSGSAAVAEVLAALPVPTGDGAHSVRGAIDRACDVEGGGMQDAVVLGSLTMLDTILREASPKLPWGRFERLDAGLAPPESTPEAPRAATVHVVQPGEWLSTIAEDHYGDPARHDVLFEANHNRIEGFDDPDHIEPGWALMVPEIDEAEAA